MILELHRGFDVHMQTMPLSRRIRLEVGMNKRCDSLQECKPHHD